MTREEWLIQAVHEIDEFVFYGNLDSHNVSFQVTCADSGNIKKFKSIQPINSGPVLVIDHQLDNPKDILTRLARNCITSFFNNPKGSELRNLCKKYGFMRPYKEANPNSFLLGVLDKVMGELPEWPGIPVMLEPKGEKDKKSNKYIIKCPNCGFRFKITKSTYEKFGSKAPTCGCGTKMLQTDPDEMPETQQE